MEQVRKTSFGNSDQVSSNIVKSDQKLSNLNENDIKSSNNINLELSNIAQQIEEDYEESETPCTDMVHRLRQQSSMQASLHGIQLSEISDKQFDTLMDGFSNITNVNKILSNSDQNNSNEISVNTRKSDEISANMSSNTLTTSHLKLHDSNVNRFHAILSQNHGWYVNGNDYGHRGGIDDHFVSGIPNTDAKVICGAVLLVRLVNLFRSGNCIAKSLNCIIFSYVIPSLS